MDLRSFMASGAAARGDGQTLADAAPQEGYSMFCT
jgi:hypothetical protein